MPEEHFIFVQLKVGEPSRLAQWLLQSLVRLFCKQVTRVRFSDWDQNSNLTHCMTSSINTSVAARVRVTSMLMKIYSAHFSPLKIICTFKNLG